MMTKQQIIDDQNDRINQLRQYATDLKNRHDKMVTALANLASGLGRVTDKGEDWQHSMKRLAREELAEVSKMQLRKTWL